MTPSARVVVHHTIAELELDHPDVANALLDHQDMHCMIMRPFRHWVPDGDPHPRAQMGILFTTAADLSRRTLTVIIQSRVPADFSAFPHGIFAAPPQSHTVDLTISAGQQYHFRVAVNPARYHFHNGRYTRDGPADSSPRATLDWFTDRLQPPGTPNWNRSPLMGADAHADHLTARTLPTLNIQRPKHHMVISRGEVAGQLTVTDPHTFADTLTHGLGRFRAYGCGLLLVQPVGLHHENPLPQPDTTTHGSASGWNTPQPPPTPATPDGYPTSSPRTSTPSPSTASAQPTPTAPHGPSTNTAATSAPSTPAQARAGTSRHPANSTPTSPTPSARSAGRPPRPAYAHTPGSGHASRWATRICASSTSKPPAYTIPGPSRSPSAARTTSSSTN